MPGELDAFLSVQIGTNSVLDYAVAFGIFIIVIAAFKTIKFVIIRNAKRLTAKTKTDLDDLFINSLDDIHWYFYIFVALFLSSQYLKLPQTINSLFYYLLVVGAAYNAIIIVQKLIDHVSAKIVKEKQKEDGVDAHTISIIEVLTKISKYSLWAVASLLVLSNMGYNITTLLAGLSIGGIAVAFAMQNTLSDIFSWFTIYFDKPFRVGDFIAIGADMGVVKKIGIKSTRLQTLQGEELIISNRELTSARVQNFKRMEKRRIAFSFGLVYQTSNAKIKKALQIVKDAISDAKTADLDRVHFKKFGDSSLDFEVVYYIKSGDYKAYMDTQQEINMSIKEKFEKEKIEFAYPTRTIYSDKIP